MLMSVNSHFVTLLAVVSLGFCIATVATAAEPELLVKAGRGATNIRVRQEEGVTVIDATSAGGIGQLTVQNGGQPWPMAMKLRLRYDAKRPFTHLEGLTLSDSRSRLQTFLGSETVEVNYADGATRRDAPKPELFVLKGNGTIEVTLPVAWLADEKEFRVHWIDFYRG